MTWNPNAGRVSCTGQTQQQLKTAATEAPAKKADAGPKLQSQSISWCELERKQTFDQQLQAKVNRNGRYQIDRLGTAGANLRQIPGDLLFGRLRLTRFTWTPLITGGPKPPFISSALITPLTVVADFGLGVLSAIKDAVESAYNLGCWIGGDRLPPDTKTTNDS